MKKLTPELLEQIREEYFVKKDHKVVAGKTKKGEDVLVSCPREVFREYHEWIKKGNKEKTSYFMIEREGGIQDTADCLMDVYIRDAFQLANHLLENNYPLENILKILPKGCSDALVKKLSES